MTRLVSAIRALNKAMGDRPWLLLFEQTHRGNETAKVGGQFGGGFVPAMRLAALATECVRQIAAVKEAPDEPMKPEEPK